MSDRPSYPHADRATPVTQQSAARLGLSAIRAQFESDGDVPKLLNAVLTSAIAVTRADFGNIQIVETGDGGLRIVAQQGFEREFLNFFRYVKEDKSACSAALRARRRTIIRDVARSPIYTESARQTMLAANARACQSTPIVGSTGQVLGIISTHFRAPHRPTDGQLALIDTLANSVAELMERNLPQAAPLDVFQIIEQSRNAASKERSATPVSITNVLHERGTVRVVIAEADDDTRSVFGESLKRAGCDVVDAADGRDALVKALSQRPTLVITETRLPIIDGYALCEILRRDAATHTVPILVVTAETRPTQLERARAAGVDGVLTKPITPDQLLIEIRRVLERGEREHGADSPDANPPPKKQARTSHAKAHLRTRTTTPPAPPPQLTCPSCDRPLKYEHSHIGGVSHRHAEQWDAFTCPASCGTFEYRQRTRKLRRVS